MARFDLNLLSALHALLDDRNVTRASERLNVTQPTMSGMLHRLRGQFDDELLVRNGREMELTPFGASLVDPVREALLRVELLMHAEPVFDPGTSTRQFALMASHYCMSMFLPEVVSYVAQHAPGVRLIMNSFDDGVDRIFAGDIDLCITPNDLSLYTCQHTGAKLQSEELFSDEFVCVVAEDHPLTDGASLEALLSFPHVGVQMGGAVGTLDAMSLRKYAPLHKPTYVVPDFSLVAWIVAQSNAVGVIQSRLAEVAARTLAIRSFRPPIGMPTLKEAMLWHARHLDDPAHAWLRDAFRRVAATWSAQSASTARDCDAAHARSSRTALRLVDPTRRTILSANSTH